MRQGAQGWYTGMTLRDGMGREVGEGFRMGDTCTHVADSCQCMAKVTIIEGAESRWRRNRTGDHFLFYKFIERTTER